MDTMILPTHARPREVFLIREDKRIPLELAFQGVDHRGFGLWHVSTRVRTTDRIEVTDLGYNFIRAEYEACKR